MPIPALSPKSQKEIQTHTYPITLTGLSLDVRDADIRLTRGTGSEIEIVTSNDPKRQFGLADENGTLRITHPDNRKWYQFISLGFFEHSDSISIALPEGYQGNIVLQTASGDITVNDITLQTPLRVKTSSGDTEIHGLEVCGNLEIRQSSGRLSVSDSTVHGVLSAISSSGDCSVSRTECTSLLSESSSGDCIIGSVTAAESLTATSSSGSVRLTGSGTGADIRLRTTSGDISVRDLSGAVSVSAKTSSGDIRLQDSTCESLQLDATSGSLDLTHVQTGTAEAETSSGDIRCSKFSITGSMSLRCTSGDIICRMENHRSDFTFYTETGSGDCNIPNDGINGPIEVRARTSSGDIRFYFE